MHHHFSTYYEIERKYRAEELDRELDKKCWIRQAKKNQLSHPNRKRNVLSVLLSFFF